jgi:hypothetical protein
VVATAAAVVAAEKSLTPITDTGRTEAA